MGKPTLIIYSEVSWAFLDQRHHHLARFFADAGFSVQFVERVVNRIPPLPGLARALKERLLGALRGDQSSAPSKPVPEGIRLRRSFFLPHGYGILRPWNYLYWLLAERFRQRGAVLYSFVDNPALFGGRLARFRLDRLAVFDVIHNWWAFPWQGAYHRRAVARMLRLADRVVTDSEALRHRELASLEAVHVMLPGVGHPWFGHPRDSKGAAAPVPRPAFFGNLRGNSDLPFVEAIASAVGLDGFGLLSGEAAAQVPSLCLRGQMAAEALPAALAPYNVLVLPYNRDAFSATIAPAKYFEALATGALLVTRASLYHLPGFDRFCLVVDEERGAALAELLRVRLKAHQAQQQAQIAFARTQSWEARFAALRAFLAI